MARRVGSFRGAFRAALENQQVPGCGRFGDMSTLFIELLHEGAQQLGSHRGLTPV